MELLLFLPFIFAPTYAVNFQLAGLPLNMLLVVVGSVELIWLVYFVTQRKFYAEFVFFWQSQDKALWLLPLIFLFAGLQSLFFGGVNLPKVGEFIVLFGEPILLYFFARFYFQQKPHRIPDFLWLVVAVLGISGVLALVQYFSLWTLPPEYWGNSEEPKRALAIFVHPNFYALFIAPLLALLLPKLFESVGSLKHKFTTSSGLFVVMWVLGFVGLILSLSRGGWMGFFASCLFLLIVSGNKKLWLGLVVAGVVGVVIVTSIPVLRYRVVLPFKGEKSSVSRLSLWQTAGNMVKDSPVLGQGLLGFDQHFITYNQDPNLGHYKHPHNIVLNFWVDTGLLGLITFLLLVVYWLRRGMLRGNAVGVGVSLFLITLVVHGLVDVPYMKNDLAIVFWLVLALV